MYIVQCASRDLLLRRDLHARSHQANRRDLGLMMMTFGLMVAVIDMVMVVRMMYGGMVMVVTERMFLGMID